MPTSLVIRTTAKRTVTHFRVDQDYTRDPQDLARRVHRQMRTEHRNVAGEDIGDFVAAALCDSDFLEGCVPLDSGVDIVDGRVVRTGPARARRDLPAATELEPARRS